MLDEKELDEFIDGELKKDITQEDKIDESVEKHMGEMGFLWDRVQSKMQKDAVCFDCKKEQNFKEGDVSHIVEANNVEKGVVAFVSICNKCMVAKQKEMKEAHEKKQEGEKNGNK